MKIGPWEGSVQGRWFVLNIARPESSNGLAIVERDPRKDRLKSDMYSGVVEAVGPDCTLVKTGDTVSVRRWIWDQADVDDERIMASEDHLVVLNEGLPAPGMIAVKVIGDTPETSLYIPDTYRPESKRVVRGEIIAWSPHLRDAVLRHMKKGDILHFERSDEAQWYGSGRAIIKDSRYFSIYLVEHQEAV